MPGQYLVVFCTCPNAETAGRIADAVVAEGHAACVNMVSGVTSIYLWQGERQRDTEVLLIMKTRAAAYSALEARIRELHSYQTPEVIALPIAQGSAPYLAWIDANSGSSS